MDWDSCSQSIFLGDHSAKEESPALQLKKSPQYVQDHPEILNQADDDILDDFSFSIHNS
jgi:hypothetical protein